MAHGTFTHLSLPSITGYVDTPITFINEEGVKVKINGQQHPATQLHKDKRVYKRYTKTTIVWKVRPEAGAPFILKGIIYQFTHANTNQGYHVLQREAQINQALYPTSGVDLLFAKDSDSYCDSFWTIKMPYLGSDMAKLSPWPTNSKPYYRPARELWQNFNDRVLFEALAKLFIDLAFLHIRYGCIHSDIKPANLFLDRQALRMGDFGLCSITDHSGRFSVKSRRYGHVGTPLYLAPETRAYSAEMVTPLIDIWSLGLSLFELCFRPLFFNLVDAYRSNQDLRADSIKWLGRHLGKPHLSYNLRELSTKSIALLTSCLRGMLQHHPGERASPTDLLGKILTVMPELKGPVIAAIEVRFPVRSETLTSGEILENCHTYYQRLRHTIQENPKPFLRPADQRRATCCSKKAPFRNRRNATLILTLTSLPLMISAIYALTTDATSGFLSAPILGTERTFDTARTPSILIFYGVCQALLVLLVTQFFCCFPVPFDRACLPTEKTSPKPDFSTYRFATVLHQTGTEGTLEYKQQPAATERSRLLQNAHRSNPTADTRLATETAEPV